MSKGRVYLIPNVLGETEVSTSIPQHVISLSEKLRYFIVENIKVARRYLRKMHPDFPINDATFFELNKHTNLNDVKRFLAPAKEGHDIGIISDAGCPGIADPGSIIVKLAHEQDINVIPLVGPSSILLALISSGFNGQNFTFHGYLPKDKNERSNTLRQYEKWAKQATQIFMDTPYRNMAVLEDILASCQSNTLLCIACDITLKSEFIKTKPISYWKKHQPNLHKRPCLFLIGS